MRTRIAARPTLPLALVAFFTLTAHAQPDQSAQKAPAPKPQHQYSDEARGLANRVNHAVKLRPEQREAMLETLRAYDVELKAYEKANNTKSDEYGFQALGAARLAGDKKKIFEIESKRAKDDQALTELEDKYYDLVESKVLTPDQVPALQSFHLYYRATFPLNWVSVIREQGDKIKAMADEVVKEISKGASPQRVYEKRLARLNKRVREEVLTEEQRTKLTKLEADREALLKGQPPQ
jgi:hypothetical protein